MSRLLLTKIDAVRRKQVIVAACSAVSLAIAAAVVLVALEMFFDWIFDFPLFIRAAALVAVLAVIGYILARYMVMPIVRGADDDELALLVEADEPQFEHRLIASIQLSRAHAIPAGASVSLVRAMIEQAEAMARAIDFTRVIKIDRLMKYAITAALVVLISGAAFVYGNSPDHTTGDLLKRAFLSNIPVPRKTHVQVIDPDQKIALGDSVDLSARALGICPSSGMVYLKSDSGRTQQFPMDPTAADHRVFSRTIGQVQESFTYTIKLNDGTSEPHTVKVLGRPDVAALKVTEKYPAYTRKSPVDLQPGNLSILDGSTLQLKVTANHKISTTANTKGDISCIHLVGGSSGSSAAPGNRMLGDITLKVDPSNPMVLTAEFKVPPKTSGFSINLVDQDGLENKDPVVYPIDLVPDKDPSVKILDPIDKENLETKDATFPVLFEAADDYGLAGATLKYKVDDGPVNEVPFTITSDPLSFRYRYIWDLSKVTVPPSTTRPSLEGSNIEFWVEVVDNNSETGPGKGNSEHFLIKIVSREAKEEELARKISEQLQLLQASQAQQEGVNQATSGMLVPAKKTPPSP